MKVTIRDVAELAGVSPSTVSRVLHDSPKISERTKEIVTEAMERLKYEPSPIAQGLAGRKTRTLGLLLPNSPEELFINPFFIKAMKGLSIFAQTKGYRLMYSFSKDEDEEVGFIKNYVRDGWVEGIILFTSRQNDRCIAYLKDAGFPFVVIGRPEDTKGTNWVDNDNFQAMYNVVNYLVVKGYHRIAFIGGPLSFDVTRYRLQGYKQALINRGIDLIPELVQNGQGFIEQAGYDCMENILRIRKPEAVTTTDDLLAFGALKALEDHGIDDVAVTGFNNTIRGEFQTPSLTTVDINPEELGVKAAELLLSILEGEELVPNHHIVETRLIERDTTRI